MGISYNSTITTDGLVLCLDAANPRSYPGTGNIFYDLSTYKNNFTIYGATFDDTYKSMIFNGAGDNIRRGVPSVLQIKNDITLMFLHNRNTTSGDGNGSLIRCGSGYDLLYCVFHRNDGSLAYHWYDGSFQTRYAAANCAPIGQWLFTCVRIIDTSLHFYVNGQLITSTNVTSSSPSSAGWISIGTTYGINFQDFPGYISSVLIYNRGLSSNEIRQNYNATRGRYGN